MLILKVTCINTRLQESGEIFLHVEIFDCEDRRKILMSGKTTPVPPTFPLVFNESLVLKKVLYHPFTLILYLSTLLLSNVSGTPELGGWEGWEDCSPPTFLLVVHDVKIVTLHHESLVFLSMLKVHLFCSL